MGCANSKAEPAAADGDDPEDIASGTAPSDAGADVPDAQRDGASGDSLARDAAPGDGGMTQTEPPLVVPNCDAISAETCCRSAIGFEDGSTSHFLPATCCKLALATPARVATPTACGRGALQLDADFRATSEASLCDTPAAATACAFRTGEISRAVLTSLDLTSRTVSVALYLEGAALPPEPHRVYAQIFVMAKGGVLEGPLQVISATDLWTAIEFSVRDDGTAPGADVRLLGIRISFGGQPWAGRVYVDEISWRPTPSLPN